MTTGPTDTPPVSKAGTPNQLPPEQQSWRLNSVKVPGAGTSLRPTSSGTMTSFAIRLQRSQRGLTFRHYRRVAGRKGEGLPKKGCSSSYPPYCRGTLPTSNKRGLSRGLQLVLVLNGGLQPETLADGS
eukprot:1160295-Pelagomonas_calceolata.AAC.1